MKIPTIIAAPASVALAQKIASAVGGEVFSGAGDGPVAAMQIAYREGRPIVALLATAIVIRALAPLLGSKFDDPPVVAVSRSGDRVVPLLGLHHGANALAHRIAATTGGDAAITTGTAQISDVALDECPPGYSLRNPADYKDFAVALLAGEPVRIDGAAPWLSALPQSEKARLRITVTDGPEAGGPGHLVYAVQRLAIGIGCERGTDPGEVQALIAETLARHGLAADAIACHASIDLKEDEPAIFQCRNIRFFSREALAAETPRLATPSAVVEAEVGVPGVAEAAALAAAGPDAELIVAKTKSKRATCAIARAPHPVVDPPGRGRGRLSVVGLGPGSPSLRSPEASAALWAASDWVGYGLYLDLCQDMRHGQTEHRFPLGGEEDRVRHAIALAKQGKQVALICSGDAGIYAMASLVYEIVDLEPNRTAIEVIPGISAFQAAAAKAGAMIGHDFCCISLSDLLTPWEVIEKRVQAAAEGDFVISFYNPRSLKRRDQIERAMALIAPHRHADTPVVIASSLGRPEEKVRILRLADFNPEDVDMLTLVMIGASQSRSFTRGDGRTYAYTPRGYARKREAT